MSSPPSLHTLKISEGEQQGPMDSTKLSPASDSSSSSAPSPTDASALAPDPQDTDGTSPSISSRTSSSNKPEEIVSPPAPEGTEPPKNETPGASRPAPPPPTASAPPRIGAARGGMQVPMGMRGSMKAAAMPSRIPASLQAKMDAVVASRAAAPSPLAGGGAPSPNATSMSALLRSQALGQSKTPQGPNAGPLGLAARRAAGSGPSAFRPSLGSMGSGMSSGLGRPAGMGVGGRRGPPGGMSLSGMKGAPEKEDNKFTDFGKIVDPSGSLRFSKKAVLHSKGVDFEGGKSFKINMDEIEVIGELGRGNYGSVQQVFHRPTGVMMAMKEIRLELDESKLNGIIMELDILHRAVAPEIVEFYGAFTIESCVYYCMELMDAGSLDTLTGGGQPAKAGETDQGEEGAEDRVPEEVLRRITYHIVKGLKFLKDELQIMHRDVKPTNVLINKKGEVKLVDFGVSGQLEKSLAKTNIGCQSYMAPERIKGESQNQPSTYTVSSDVWSVGLSIIELARGCYPYPPETFANVFAQLTAIVHGPAPTLPKGYSAEAQNFVALCLLKDPNARPTYAQLLEHPFLLADKDANVDMVGWAASTLERRAARGVPEFRPPESS